MKKTFYKVYGGVAVRTNRRGDIKYTPSEYSFKELMAKFNTQIH